MRCAWNHLDLISQPSAYVQMELSCCMAPICTSCMIVMRDSTYKNREWSCPRCRSGFHLEDVVWV